MLPSRLDGRRDVGGFGEWECLVRGGRVQRFPRGKRREVYLPAPSPIDLPISPPPKRAIKPPRNGFRRRFSGLFRRRRRYPTMDSRGRSPCPSPPTRSFPLGLCVRHSICRPELSRTRGSAARRTRRRRGRTGDLVSWLTREIRRSRRRRRSANRGERMSGRGGEKGAKGLQLSQILRHLPRTRSTGHSDPMNPGSTTCLSLPLYVLPCNLLFSLSRHPSVVPPSFPLRSASARN